MLEELKDVIGELGVSKDSIKVEIPSGVWALLLLAYVYRDDISGDKLRSVADVAISFWEEEDREQFMKAARIAFCKEDNEDWKLEDLLDIFSTPKLATHTNGPNLAISELFPVGTGRMGAAAKDPETIAREYLKEHKLG